MKKIILIILIIIELCVIKIPTYTELNNLAIIEEIGIIEEHNHYTIILKEIIPTKDDQGISYEYKYYKDTASTIDKAYKNIIKSTKKKLYLKQTKSLITNITSSSEIIDILDINPKNITHTKDDIYKLLKEN